MENTVDNIAPKPTSSNESSFSNKNIIIIILVALLVFSFLGINLLTTSGNIIQTITNIFGPLVVQILSIFGYTAGTIIDKTADLGTDVAKTGIDVIDGTLHSVGGLLKSASQQNVDDKAKRQLDQTINNGQLYTQSPAPSKEQNKKPEQAEPDKTSSPIQNPIASNKSSWCLVGEYQGKRGCIEITDQDKCLSGQVFPQQKMCLNPTLSNNMSNLNALKSVPG